MELYCKQCGALLKENAKFCNKCGAPVTKEELPAEEILEQKDLNEYSSTAPVGLDETVEPQDTGVKTTAGNVEMPSDKKGFNLTPNIIAALLCVAAVAVFIVVKYVLPSGNNEKQQPAEEIAAVADEDESNAAGSTDNETEIAEETPVQEEQQEETEALPDQTENPEEEEAAIIVDEEFVARGWYTYYISYLDAINHKGDASYLKNASDERMKSFVVNYEKYNKGYTFENVSFDVDKTDMKLKDLGDGMIEATCHAYAVNICTTIATGAVEDNRVTLLGKLRIDSKTGDWLLMEQQSDKNFAFGKDELIHCAD